MGIYIKETASGDLDNIGNGYIATYNTTPCSPWVLNYAGVGGRLQVGSEEGTFTPHLADASLSSSEGQTYSSRYGWYQRCGNMVQFTIYLLISSFGTLTTSDPAYIIGLPYTPQDVCPVMVGYANNLSLPSAGIQLLAVALPTGAIGFRHNAGTGSCATTLLSQMSTGEMRVSGFYRMA